MKKYFILILIFSNLFSIDLSEYECNISKLSNISSNRALTTLKALGYYTIEHENIYVEDEITNDLQPSEFDLEEVSDIFIVDIPDSETSSLNGSSDDEDEISQFLYGISMDSSTDSDPVERIMVCYAKENPNVYRSFLNILYNQLDVPAQQILIEALIIEINSEDLNDTGISANYIDTDDNLNISTPANGNPLSIIYSENNFTETLISDETGFPVINYEETDYIKSTLENNLEVKINALINTKSAEILSRPSILVLDGRQARIQVGQQIPITKQPMVSGNTSDNFIFPDIEYLPVGIVLNLKPRISNDSKNITMQVETIITETDSFVSDIQDAPIINNRKVESYVRVSDNTPFIIGGLISNKKSDSEGKIPLLSKIPWLGKLFTWRGKQNVKKEVIVVITPHIIEDDNDNFSRVIPQDATIFDSFDNKLFPNSYRLKESDVFDLNFITNSNYLNKIRSNALNISNNITDIQRNITEEINNGFIPGENIITQRMIYEIVENQNYFDFVNTEQIIFFNNDKNNKVDFLKNYSSVIDDPRRALLLSINNETSDDNSFFRPSISLEEIVLTEDYNYKDLLYSYGKSNSNVKPILISNQKNLKRLSEVLVLKEVLKLNGDLDLSIKDFKRGLALQFPSKEIIKDNFFVIDEDISTLFYNVNFYYESFEEEFKSKTEFLNK